MPREELRALRRLQRDQGPVTRDGAYWWSKPLKELRMATFNARAETVETKPVFRDALKRTRCLIPMSGYYETPSRKQPWYFTARWLRAVAERGGRDRMLKPAPNDFLQRWPVSKKVNSSNADADDTMLIDRVELATA